ncbi:MAG: hypothetical protein IKD74_06385 [Clostridia bacterium]|jgi:hypothetical protein|nr:hypothetical protein [Clostridia bacterium]
MSKKSIHDKIKVDMVEGLITEKGEFIPEKGISVKNKEVRNLSPEQIKKAKERGEYDDKVR